MRTPLEKRVCITLAVLLSIALIPTSAIADSRKAWADDMGTSGQDTTAISGAASNEIDDSIQNLDSALTVKPVEGAASGVKESALFDSVESLESFDIESASVAPKLSARSIFPTIALQDGKNTTYNITRTNEQILNFCFTLSKISLVEFSLNAYDRGSMYYEVGSFNLYDSSDTLLDVVRVDHNDTINAGWILPAGSYNLQYISLDSGYKQTVSVGYNVAESGTTQYQMVPSYTRGNDTIPTVSIGSKYILGINFWGLAQTVQNQDLDGHYYQVKVDRNQPITLTIASCGSTMVGLFNANDDLIGAARTDGTATQEGVGSYTSPKLSPGTYVVKVITDDYRALGHPYLLSINYAAQSLTQANVRTAVNSAAYSGSALRPGVTVKHGGKTLRKGTDYTVSYKNNKNVGTATVTVTGKGAYKDTKTATFKIVPKGVSVSKLAKAKKAFTVKWKKPSKANLKQTTGYQVRYSLTKSMKGAKTKTVKATSSAGKKCTLKVTKLKGGKKYYVQVRTYKKVGGKTYYSSWSKAKTVKTKK